MKQKRRMCLNLAMSFSPIRRILLPKTVLNCIKTLSTQNLQSGAGPEEIKDTHFGFETVKETEKAGKG